MDIKSVFPDEVYPNSRVQSKTLHYSRFSADSEDIEDNPSRWSGLLAVRKRRKNFTKVKFTKSGFKDEKGTFLVQSVQLFQINDSDYFFFWHLWWRQEDDLLQNESISSNLYKNYQWVWKYLSSSQVRIVSGWSHKFIFVCVCVF